MKTDTNSNFLTDIDADIRSAVEVMRRGGIILYPTDTVWGIGCDATNAEAVSRVYAVKRRSDSKALITLVNSIGMLNRYVAKVPDIALELIDVSVRPLTIVYDNGVGLAGNLLADDGSVGIRLTKDSYAASLCRQLGRPVVSTSANISGEPTAHCFSEISREVIDAVDYVASYRRMDSSPAVPSTVIKLSGNCEVKIIRP